jgi:hypothetical protein
MKKNNKSLLINSNFISVKPLNQPTGLLFHMDFWYGSAEIIRKTRKEKINEIFTKSEIKNIQK